MNPRGVLVLLAVMLATSAALLLWWSSVEESELGAVSGTSFAEAAPSESEPRRDEDAQRERPAEAPSVPATGASATSPEIAEPEPAGLGAIDMLVLDHEDVAVADCEVVLCSQWRARARTRTNGDGRARFVGLAPGHYTFRIAGTGEGYANLVEGELLEEVVVRLPPQRTITGQVRTASGAAVGGAHVLVRIEHPAGESWPLTTSAPDGSFAYEAYGTPGALIARAVGRGESQPVRVHPRGDEAIELVLADQGGRLELSVRALDPAARGHVDLHHFTDESERSLDRSATRHVPIAGPGPVIFESLRPGRYRYAVVLEDHAPAAGEVEVMAIETQKREISLGRGGAVAGVVTAAGRAEPVANAVVSWRWNPHLHGAMVEMKTDADGVYRFEHLPLGMVDVVAREDGITATVAVEIIEGTTANGDVELPMSVLLAGRCVDETGAPLSDLLVLAHPPESPRRPIGRTVTDREGRFAMRLPPEVHRVDVKAPGISSKLFACEWRPTDAGLVIVIPSSSRPTGRVVGRLLDRDGEPMSTFVALQRREHGTSTAQFSRTDPSSGRFEFGHLAPSVYRLALRNDPHPTKFLATVTVASDTVDLGDLVVDLRDARLEVTLAGRDDLRLDDRTRLTLVEGEETLSLERIEDGFKISAVPAGSYTLLVQGDLAPRAIPVTLGPDEDAPLTIDVYPGVTCDVRWTAAPEAADVSYDLRIFGPESATVPLVKSRFEHGRGSDMAASFKLGVGQHRVELVATDGKQVSATFNVPAVGERLVVPLELR